MSPMKAGKWFVLSLALLVSLVGIIGSPVMALAQSKIYWTHINDPSGPGFNEIERANLDGTGLEEVLTGLTEPVGIALDVAAGKMYWTDDSDSKIRRANLDGTGVEELVTGLLNPTGIALDVAGGKMYWANPNAAKVQRANLDGTGVEDLFIG
ncbi:MAG: hypothetical protein HY710_15845, partial [Candidatus Latescibacteria bacterium]|nr:hypothetical protein [Candidatus Latescibacterota bacterium]